MVELKLKYECINIMNKTHEEFLENIDIFYNKIKNANMDELLNEDYLTETISKIGLYNETGRMHPQNMNIHVYGDDAKHMNVIKNVGMWQIPRQLSSFLIKLVSLGQVETFLDIGTCRGATITVVTIFLLRFGIKKVDTIDIIKHLHEDLHKKWKELDLPITYIIIPNDLSFNKHVSSKYDVIFIDGNHDYQYVSNDFKIAQQMTNKICFHDINDIFCVDVVRLWNEIKNNHTYTPYEFTYHSHNLKLMGIGLLVKIYSDNSNPI